MLKSYLKSAVRNIRRAKLYSVINIVGLALGLTAAMLIGLWVQNQFTYDRYNVNADRIYRVTSHWVYGSADYMLPWTAGPLAAALRQLPQVKRAVRLSIPRNDVVMRYRSKLFNISDFFYADSDFFNVFSVQKLEGNLRTALAAPYSIVLTKSIAERLFGNSDPMGEPVNIKAGEVNYDFTVTGVVRDLPSNSQFHPTCLASFSSIEKSDRYLSSWYSAGLYSYILLDRNSELSAVRRNLPLIVKQYMGKWGEEQKWSFGLQKLTDIHLHSHLIGEIEPNGSMETVMIFSAIGLFILLVSMINFISLSIARFSERAREVGVRKAVGSGRREIIAQFITEGAVLTFFSGLVSLSLVELLLPYFDRMTGETLSISLPDVLLLIGTFLVLGIASAIYPALFLSSFKPVSILHKEPFLKADRVPLRKGMIVLQYAVAIGIIASTIIASEQLQYVRNKNLGFNGSEVLVFPLRHEKLMHEYPALREAFMQIPGVENVSGASGQLGNTNFISNVWYHKSPLFQTRYLAVDYGFLKTMDIRLESGRHFSHDMPSDTTNAILVNEVAAKKLRALGMLDKNLSVGGVYDGAKVVGVMKDFNYRPLYYPLQPLVVFLKPDATRFMVVRLSSVEMTKTIDAIDRTWKEIVPDYPVDWRFQDRAFEKAYRADSTLATVFEIGAILSVFISVLGLFGLASYSAEKRVKEVGIRKVLGASVFDIVRLLTKDFVFLVAAGGLVGCPIAYFFMAGWLDSFAYKIGMTAVPFLLAGGIGLGIAVAVVGFRATRAAAANPVESLRYE